MHEYADILAAVPWHCTKHETGETWHKGQYWVYGHSDGGHTYSYDAFSDGDHVEIAEDELPDPDEEIKAWAEYRVWATEHEQDPLDEFIGAKPWERAGE